MERKNDLCPVCGAELEFSSEPVSVGGVYGDYRFQWGRVGGAHVCRIVASVCHSCGAETPLPWPFVGGIHACRAVSVVCHACGEETPLEWTFDT